MQTKLSAVERRILENQLALRIRDDEIERLRAQLSLAEKSIECFENDRVEFEAEIKRLRAHLPGGCKMLSLGDECTCGLCSRDAEIERLRAALDRIAGKALGEKYRHHEMG